MSLLTVDESSYPLTKKWLPLVKSYSYRYNIPVIELLQEAYLIEWKISSKQFDSPKHKENYFKKVLYRNLRSEVVRSVTNKHSNYKVPFFSINEYCNRINYKEEKDSDEIFDQVIQLRPFNELFFEELVNHISVILLEKDILASKLFVDKMRLQLQWKELKLKQYKEVAHNRYYSAVKRIKTVVKKEISNKSWHNNFSVYKEPTSDRHYDYRYYDARLLTRLLVLSGGSYGGK